jgi:histidyl-tRNA synthetase
MSKINKISGFPEWLPKQKLLEDKFISLIRGVYESYGFCPIETPSVELVSTLQSKGVIDKEIYLLKRAKQEDGEESDLALHFDLTVPFARYVGQHFNELSFPFKRYQLQKVWRGERPQKGRFREFYQFDIDTIALEDLPLSCDAEILSAVGDVFTKLDLGSFKIVINSRKLLHGLYAELGLKEELRKQAITIVDKLNKIGKDGVLKELSAIGVPETASKEILAEKFTRQYSPADFESLAATWSDIRKDNELFHQGLSEIRDILKLTGANAYKTVKIDLSLARGLDYYTGIILEVMLDKYPEFGSVCSGGRYEDLASQFIKKKLPGVGVSIGLSRLMEMVFANNLKEIDSEGKTKVLIAVYSEEQRAECNKLAEKLRALNISCEVYYKSPKLGKQIDYADTRNIRYVLFLNFENGSLEVKDLKTKEQKALSNIESLASLL